MGELKRTLGLFETSFFAIGVILGAGIYTIVGEVAGVAGNMTWLAFFLTSFTALFTGLSYAELSSMFPKAGGEFYYLNQTVNSKLAYIIGFAVAFSGIIGGATISVGFAGYASKLLDINQTLLALGIIGIILLINISGIRQSSNTNIIFTLIEISGLGFVVYSAWDSIGSIDYLEYPPEGMKGVLMGAALCFFAFSGFEDTVKLAEETKDPEKNIPRALFISLAFVFVVYMLVAISSISAVPFSELANAEGPLSFIVESKYGKTGALIITIIALFSTSNSLLSNMLGASRISYGMAKEKGIQSLAKVSDKTRTPVRALLIIAFITALFSLIGNIKTIAQFANFFVFTTFLLINFAVVYYRIKNKEEKRPFRIPFNIYNVPVLSILSILMILSLMGITVWGLVEDNF